MHSEQSPDVRDAPSNSQTDGGRRSAVRRLIPQYLTIATVLAPFGLRGELKVRIETDFPERFARLTQVYLGPNHEPFTFEAFRLHKGFGLLKLKGCDSRDEADGLRGWEVQIPLEEAVPLPPGQYYTYQIEGLAVYTEEEEYLGAVEEVLSTGSNAVHVVQGPLGEVLIPALADVIVNIDLEAGRMIVRLPPGLLD
jgi:16S rRNA processing protein RimM